jgi:hypothetical protein
MEENENNFLNAVSALAKFIEAADKERNIPTGPQQRDEVNQKETN